jgi:acetyl esterase
MAAVELKPRDRLAGGFARFVCGLPAPVQRALAGRPVVIDDQRLDTEMQLLLKLEELAPSPELTTLTPAESRRDLRRIALALEGPKVRVARIEPLGLPGPAGQIGARLYTPEGEQRPLPMLVYLHGGGWVRGDLDTHDNTCRFLAHNAGVLVLSIDYRLAPEHPFPAAVEDSVAAFRYACENAAELGAAPERIAVGGDSAGGNLTAVVAQLAVAEGGPVPAFQLIIYPATDFSQKRRSVKLFRKGFLLTEDDMDWYTAHYLPDEQAALDPRASPLLAEDFSGLPPAYVMTAGFDPLRDEGEAYAERVREAGVPVALRRHRGLIHGFANMTGLGDSGRAAMLEAAGALRMGLSQTATLTPR